MLLLHFQFCKFFEKQGITRATSITQHKPTVIITDNSITMFSVLVSIPPPPDLYYCIYFLTADENWTQFSMEVGHSLTLHSKRQLRGHFLYQVWIVHSALMRILLHLSSRTVRQSQPSQSLLFLTAILMHIPILCLLFLLISMVCNSLNILW